MIPNNLQPLSSKRDHLRLRSRTLLTLRQFFHSRGFIEVETPVRVPCPALETHIDAEPSGDWFLRTSPELHMKRLLAAGYERIFQIGPCFRRGERGERHHPEFTMLEWYRAGTDYLGILDDTKALLAAAGLPERPWEIIPVSDAFRRWAGWDPAATYDAARFELDLVDKVEPALARDRAVVLIDYPAEAAALSRRKPDAPHLAERWELYLNGIEIANAYSELTDPLEQRRRFEQAARERAALGKPVYAVDEAFLAALETGMPPCGGIALGIDRLAMVLAGSTSLDAVIPFRE
jgi:lysyl-tRNA synthetase class 2